MFELLQFESHGSDPLQQDNDPGRQSSAQTVNADQLFLGSA
ncbi:MAG: hypothetical protein OXH26_10000 [bacterium]|nr:hypothetical protein [bacterium]